MAVEDASFLSGLVPAQPTGTSVVSEGAGHLRVIKLTLQNSLPNVNEAVNAIHTKATAPTSTSAGLLWFDTTANELKLRNEADSAWITLAIDPTADYAILGSKPLKAVTHAIQSSTSTLRSDSYIDSGWSITHDKQSATSTLYVMLAGMISQFSSYDIGETSEETDQYSYLRLANSSGTLIVGTTDNILVAQTAKDGHQNLDTSTEHGFGVSHIWKVTAANCPDGTSGNNTFDIWAKQQTQSAGGDSYSTGTMMVWEIEE